MIYSPAGTVFHDQGDSMRFTMRTALCSSLLLIGCLACHEATAPRALGPGCTLLDDAGGIAPNRVHSAVCPAPVGAATWDWTYFSDYYQTLRTVHYRVVWDGSAEATGFR